MGLETTHKHRGEVVTSLCAAAKAALDQCGPCDIALKTGTLRLTDNGDGAIRIEGLSKRGTSQFCFALKDGGLTYNPPTSRESIRGSYQSERAFLERLDTIITNALEQSSLKRLEYPQEANPSQAEIRNRPPPQARSLQEEIAEAWSKVSQILTAPDGNRIENSVTGIDVERNRPTWNLHVRRRSDSEAVELEMISMAHNREVFFDDRIVVTPNSIVYHLADDSKPFNDERYALDRLTEWLAKREVATHKQS